MSAFALAALVMSGCAVGEPDTSSGTPVDVGSWDVQGHRGARGVRPENTLPSFEAALDAGVSTLELDLHLSADNVPVVWHDPRLDPAKCRGTDPSLPPAEDTPLVRDLTAAQLATYICDQNPRPGTYPDQSATGGVITEDGYGITTLEDLFEMVDQYATSDLISDELASNAATVQFNVELKRDLRNPNSIGDGFDGVNPATFEIAVADVIAAWGYEDRAIVQSFDHRSLWAMHTLAPSIPLAALTTGYTPDLAELAASGTSIWSPRYGDVTEETLAAAHAVNLQVIPWTVNDEDAVCSLLALGTAGIITDRPDLVLGNDGWLGRC